MKYIKIGFLTLATLSLLAGCTEPELVAPATYSCNFSFPDLSAQHPDADRFQFVLEEVVKQVPGVVAAVQSPGGSTWAGAAGMADIPNEVAMQPCHRLMVGSISKVFTAVMIFQLQDQGLLSIDDPLSQWIAPEIIREIDQADQVSLRQMLNHTSGLYDYNNTDFTFDATNQPFMKLSQEEKLEYTYGKSATHAPGTAYEYSNTNFVLLGMVVEKATGLTQAQALQQMIFDPLGLSSAAYGTVDEPLPTGVVRPYLAIKADQYIDIRHVEVSDANTGDGGIAINMQDLRVFIESLFDGQLLSPAAFSQMTQTLYEKPREEADFEDWLGEYTGLGIDLFKTPYGDAYGHTGGIFGFNAYLFYFPDRKTTLAVAFNGTNVNEWDHKEVMREAMLQILLE